MKKKSEKKKTNRVVKRRISDTSSHKTRDVGHVRHEDCADRVADLAHALVVVAARVCCGTSNNQLRAEHRHHTLKLFVVNKPSLRVQVVRHGLPEERSCRNTLLGAHVPMRKAVAFNIRVLKKQTSYV